jgi:hypothetical protein
MSVELFRYRGTAKHGGTLEYVFEAGEQNSPDTVTKNKAERSGFHDDVLRHVDYKRVIKTLICEA